MTNSATLERTTFATSRLLEFFTEKELSMQIGHESDWWPLALLKELVDNALDAYEMAGESPVIEVDLTEDTLSIRDNGPGIPAATQYKSVINVLVYAPQDGLATDADPLWRFEVQKGWEIQVVDSITLSPESAVNMEGDDHTVTATVLDQFGDPMQDVTVDFMWSLDGSEDGTATDFTSSATTDSNGEVTSTWNGDDEWGPADITASANGVESTTVSKYWAENTDSQYN